MNTMSDIRIRVPRHKKRVRIIKAKDLIEKELESYRPAPPEPETRHEEEADKKQAPTIEELENMMRETADAVRRKREEEALPVQEIEDPKRPVFSQTFTINNTNQPTEISLKNIPPESITVSEAKIEIQSAYDSGFKHGKESSDAEYRKELDRQEQWTRSIDMVVEKMKAAYLKETEKFEDVVISTAMAVAERVLQREISLDDNIAVPAVKRAVELMPGEKILEIRVNPKDFKIVRKAKSELTLDETKIRDVEFIPDITLEQGECYVKTPAGDIESRIKHQLEKIEEELHKSLENPDYKESKALDPESEIDLDRVMQQEKEQEQSEDPEYKRPDLTNLDLFKDY